MDEKNQNYKMKPSFIRFTPKRNKGENGPDGYDRKKRMGRIIMIADIILVIMIFGYINYITQKSPYNFGRAISVQRGQIRFRMNLIYMKDLYLFSVNISAENTSDKSLKLDAQKKDSNLLSLQLNFTGEILLKREWQLPKKWQAGEVKLFTVEISEGLIQKLFSKHPGWVIPKKTDSFISFDTDKIKGNLTVSLGPEIILQKEILFQKRKIDK